MRKILITATLIISLIGHAFSQAKPDTHFELYILIGQSNMAGRGVITPEFQQLGHSRVFMLNKDGSWVTAKHPVHYDKPAVAGVGPGLSFGIMMAEENHKVKIGLIPCAVGGTPIEAWTPGAWDQATQTHPYDDALLRVKTAMKSGVIKGIIWHQGEANSSKAKSKLYLKQLDSLVNRIRKEVGNPKLPFVVGELGQYRPRYSIVNAKLAKVPKMIPFSGLVSSADLIHKGDSTHFDGPSADLLGRRFAEKMIEIQHPKP